MEPIGATCSREFTAVHNSGVRPISAIKWIVLHSTEGDTAKGAASWFQNTNSAGSAHLCVDDETCYRTLSNNEIPWAAPGANQQGFHIEQAGYAHWTTAEWNKHPSTLKRSAFKAALHAQLFSIPLVWLDANDLRAGKRGVTTHAECTIAFGGDHTDPGPHFPRAAWMKYAKGYLAKL